MKTTEIRSDNLVRQIDDQTMKTVLGLLKKGINPHLAVIVVGSKIDSLFIKLKKKRAKELGIIFSVYNIPAIADKKEIETAIEFLNKDDEIHGIIMQLPLPKKWSLAEVKKLAAKIDIKKDVDGFGYDGKKGFLPTTADAIMQLCHEHKVQINGATVIGKGLLVGQPIKKLAQKEKIKIAVTDDKDKNLNKKIFNSQVIICGTNCANPFLDDKFVQEGATIIAAGNEINHKKLEGYAEAMTPQKGGVGPLTISLLMRNVVEAVKK